MERRNSVAHSDRLLQSSGWSSGVLCAGFIAGRNILLANRDDRFLSTL